MFQKDGAYMPIRIPPEVKEWLRSKAKRNLSSMTAETVRLLRDAMDAEQREGAVR
jgi:hypothetical protein